MSLQSQSRRRHDEPGRQPDARRLASIGFSSGWRLPLAENRPFHGHGEGRAGNKAGAEVDGARLHATAGCSREWAGSSGEGPQIEELDVRRGCRRYPSRIGALEDVSDISETAQEAITDPGSSPLVWIGGGLLAVVGLTQLNRILGR